MKKIYLFSIVAVVVLALLTSATCSEEDDDTSTETNSGNQTGDKTSDNKTDDKTSDNKTDNKTDDKTDNNKTDDQTNTSAFTKEEIAKANTAANIKSLSQMEKDIILYCNLARLDGAKFWAEYGNNAKGSTAYVSSLESDLKSTKNLPMLEPEKSLMEAAAYHANDMYQNNFFEHKSSDGTSFGARVRSYYKGNAIAENISAGMNTAIGVVMQLLVDDGLSTLGHRKNILGAQYVAIGIKTSEHKTWRTVTVQDFGDKMITKME